MRNIFDKLNIAKTRSLTADEAREFSAFYAQEKINEIVSAWMQSCDEHIEMAVNEGKFNIDVETPLMFRYQSTEILVPAMAEVKNRLRARGYKVDLATGIIGLYISWEVEKI